MYLSQNRLCNKSKRIYYNPVNLCYRLLIFWKRAGTDVCKVLCIFAGKKQITAMKKICILLCTLLAAMPLSLMAKVKLAYPYADSMVVQRDKPVTLRGTADAGEPIVVTYFKKKYQTQATAAGTWQIELPAHKAGGPYSIQVNEVVLKEVLFGDVWLCSGQSNMELPVRRVMDLSADEAERDRLPEVRLFRVERQTPFGEQPEEVISQGWKSLNLSNAYEFSALAYFFAKEMYARTGIPQGVIQAAVGGSPVQAWIGRELLEDYPLYISQLDLYSSDEYREQVSRFEEVAGRRWSMLLAGQEKQLGQDWQALDYADDDWEQVDVFRSSWAADAHGNLNGVHWFRKEVQLTAGEAARPATLRLGCLVDADQVYVNGVFVGTTGYRYPPRIYTIPQGVLKEGKNVIAVRLESQGGRAEFVPDKLHAILWGESPWLCRKKEFLSLDGQWKHRMAVQMPPRQGTTFFQYMPTVLYKGMVAPLAPLQLAGAVWYQGESNVARPLEYRDLLNRLMQEWRACFRDPQLPFLIVEMADYERPVGDAWRKVQQAQREAAEADPRAAWASASDLGEWNDIHPLNKKELGVRLAEQALKFVNP